MKAPSGLLFPNNFFWVDSLITATVYGLFVVTVSIHAALGLRVVMFEWWRIRGEALNGLSWFAFVVLLAIGIRAVIAVIAA